MSETTNIAWADSTFNPWIGCTQVGPGCDGCYAEALMDRRMGRVKWGAGEKRQRTSEAYWRQPLAWDRKARESGKPWRVFCASLADVFDNEVPAAWRWALFRLIRETPHLTWMLLTKRIGNAIGMLDEAADAVFDEFVGAGAWQARGPWPNVWIGATVVNQEEADRDIPKLLAVPAAVRFLSIEPMLGPINLAHLRAHNGAAPMHHNCLNGYTSNTPYGLIKAGLPDRFGPGKVDWVIVGGESDQPGHRARPFVCGWGKDIVRQCKAAGVPVFVKQLGDNATNREGEPHPTIARAGADPSEWPADLRVREFPR